MSGSRKIHCHSCKIYVGEIRDATLRKGMIVFCAQCAEKMEKNTLDAVRAIFSKKDDGGGGFDFFNDFLKK